MKSIKAWYLFLWLVAVPLLSQAQEVEKKFPADGIKQLQLVTDSTDVRVVAWNNKEITIRGVASPQVQIENNRLDFQLPNGDSSHGQPVTILLPDDIQVSAKSQNGRLTVQGMASRVDLATISGKVEVSSCAASLQIETTSGDIKVREIKGDVTLKSVSGELSLLVIDGMLVEAKTVTGNISARAIKFRQGRLGSQSGDIEMSGKLQVEGVLEVTNFSGDIRMDSFLSDHLTLEAKSRYGRVKVSGELKARGQANNWFCGDRGAGGPLIRLSSYSGKILVGGE